MREFGIGQSVLRSEDLTLLRGRGRFTDDIVLPRQTHLFVVRSPHAAARVRSIRFDRAAQLPGVLAIVTGEDVLSEGLGTFPSRVKRQRPDGGQNFEPPFRALACGYVGHVGDAVAAVVAETLAIAKDAAELVEIDYESLPAIAETSAAARPESPVVWASEPDNICFVYEVGDKARVEAAFKDAFHVASLDFVITRVSANPMEPRGAIGVYDPGDGRFTLYAAMQAPHAVRAEIAELVFKIPENKLRIVSPDCGGSFGMKEGVFPEYILVLWMARRLGRPVRWQCERSEAFISDHHARDNAWQIQLALDRTGRFLALRAKTTANLGAYLDVYGNHSPTNNLGGLAGTYVTPCIYAHVTGVFTNTLPTSPYRGAGRPEASYAIERIIDHAAREMGIDRVELRRRNMIPPSAMPYKTGLVFTYDCGEFEKNMDLTLGLCDWKGFEARRAAARLRGRLRGIGLASVIEIAGGPAARPYEEHAEIRFDPGGNATILTGTHTQGQGHETTFTQIASDLLGLPPDRIRIVYGDTDQIFHGRGTFGSRSAAAVGTALLRATEKILAKGRRIAAHLLEADPADIVFGSGAFTIAGTDRSIDLVSVARAAFRYDALPPDVEPGLGEAAMVAARAPTFPNGCHACEVEIDPDTGTVDVVGYWVVDDVGRMVNPALVAGQLHGGIAQGLGQALFEVIHYDPESGQLLSGSFQDYCMPRADNMPSIAIESNEVPTHNNPIGIKGAGEAGAVGALPAVMNAINDALAPLGIRHFDMPATPERIWRAIRSTCKQETF